MYGDGRNKRHCSAVGDSPDNAVSSKSPLRDGRYRSPTCAVSASNLKDILVIRRYVTEAIDRSCIGVRVPRYARDVYRDSAPAIDKIVLIVMFFERTLPIDACNLKEVNFMDYIRQAEYLDSRHFESFRLTAVKHASL